MHRRILVKFLWATVTGFAILSLGDAAIGDDNFQVLRERMVKEQMEERGIHDPRVLATMRKVERHKFVPLGYDRFAYADSPVPIGHGQTISQPYIVAFMTEAAELSENDRVLEIGTGSGYQAAVLAEIVQEVYTIEILEPLARDAGQRLKELGYKNINVKTGDGYRGWPEKAPFDAIIVTAAPEEIPKELVQQLAEGGRMIVPVGTSFQELLRLTKTPEGIRRESLLPVRFVPMMKGQ